MDFFLKYDVSLLSTFMLLILYITIKFREDTTSVTVRLFNILIWVNIYMLMLEILSWHFDGMSGEFNWYANYVINLLFSWSSPLITCVWASYIDYHMFHSLKRLKKRWFYMQPMIIMTIFMIINFSTPFIFSVNENNIYSREPFVWLIILLNTSMVIYKWVDAYKHKDKINRQIVVSMLAFLLLPTIAAVAQVLIYGAFIIWPIMSITIIVFYIHLETVSTSTDYLTGLMSRYRVDDHISYLINKKQKFGLVIIDLDDFKNINDEFGHAFGDKALRIFSKNLKSSFSKNAIVGRFGGDEFIIITKTLTETEIAINFNKLSKRIKEVSSENKIPFEIKYSFGYYIWDKKDNLNYEELLDLADKDMYKNKKEQKNLKKSDQKK
jgi:diguanylate cyclase (GGDEF)-like protein